LLFAVYFPHHAPLPPRSRPSIFAECRRVVAFQAYSLLRFAQEDHVS
jgi:hypothetical protein